MESLRHEDGLLEVSHLSVSFTERRKSYGNQESEIRAVDDVSFGLSGSETIAIVGESGSGKSTLGRCIMGLIRPTSGLIRYNGAIVSELTGKDLLSYRKDVQMIYQDPFESLDPGQDVFSTISVPIQRLAGEKEYHRISDRVDELLQDVGLDPERVRHRFPHQLSGGEKQRVNICRALASKPKLLIADEPTTMLDAAQRISVLRLLTYLKTKMNLTVLMITHDLHSAMLTTQRTIVMYRGKFVEIGDTQSVFRQPHHPYVDLILESTPRLEGRDEKELPTWGDDDAGVDGCAFRARCKYSTEICSRVEPTLSENTPHHYAACHNPLHISRGAT